MLRFYAVVVVVALALVAFASAPRGNGRGVLKIHSLKINRSARIAKS